MNLPLSLFLCFNSVSAVAAAPQINIEFYILESFLVFRCIRCYCISNLLYFQSILCQNRERRHFSILQNWCRQSQSERGPRGILAQSSGSFIQHAHGWIVGGERALLFQSRGILFHTRFFETMEWNLHNFITKDTRTWK